MAKSTRSKVKRSFRAKKRTDGVYAATEAARLQRLHNKLKAIASREPDAHDDDDGDEMEEGARMETDGDAAAQAADGQSSTENANAADAMDTDANAASSSSTSAQRISTHGPRNSRRESWRASKGLVPRPKSNGVNRQGLPVARRKAGRSHRRR